VELSFSLCPAFLRSVDENIFLISQSHFRNMHRMWKISVDKVWHHVGTAFAAMFTGVYKNSGMAAPKTVENP
jgi:hypothetical protein